MLKNKTTLQLNHCAYLPLGNWLSLVFISVEADVPPKWWCYLPLQEYGNIIC